jgi:hypothetical protein
MPSSLIWGHVALLRTDVSENHITSIIRVEGISYLGTSAVTTNELLVIADRFSSPILLTLMIEAIRCSETWPPTRATGHIIPEDGILHSPAVKTSNLT